MYIVFTHNCSINLYAFTKNRKYILGKISIPFNYELNTFLPHFHTLDVHVTIKTTHPRNKVEHFWNSPWIHLLRAQFTFYSIILWTISLELHIIVCGMYAVHTEKLSVFGFPFPANNEILTLYTLDHFRRNSWMNEEFALCKTEAGVFITKFVVVFSYPPEKSIHFFCMLLILTLSNLKSFLLWSRSKTWSTGDDAIV